MHYAKAQDWVTHKQNIHQLYIVQNLTLKDVQRQMTARYGFNATERMYNSRFQKWGFTKYKRRAKKSESPLSQCPNPPPPPSPPNSTSTSITLIPKTPYPITIPECILHLIKQYTEISCRSNLWYTSKDGQFTTSRSPAHAESHLNEFVSHWIKGLSPTRQHAQNSFEEMNQSLDKACDLIPKLVRAEHPHLLRAVLELLRYYDMAGCYEMAQVVLRQFCRITDLILGRRHPLTSVWLLFLSTGKRVLEEVARRALECGVAVLSTETRSDSVMGTGTSTGPGRLHYRIMQSRVSLSRCQSTPGLLGTTQVVLSKQLLVDNPSSKCFSYFDEMLLDNIRVREESGSVPGSGSRGEEVVLDIDIRQYAHELRMRERLESDRRCLATLHSIFYSLSKMTYALVVQEETYSAVTTKG